MEKDAEKKCGVCKIPYFERNNYFYGKLMTVRDFFAEQCYFNEKRWLINRMVNGWGVVCGLDVKLKPLDRDNPDKGNDLTKVVVTPGLAIDCCGREILVCEEQVVSLTIEEPPCLPVQSYPSQEKLMAICLEYYECKTEKIPLPHGACDQKERCEFNRIKDSFKITPIVYEEDCSQENPLCPQTKEEREKSFHQYLCDRFREGCLAPDDCHCVILATFIVDENYQIQGDIDTCSKRRLVYTNPLLYDLIYCHHSDLPRISDFSWNEFHDNKIDWREFHTAINGGLTVTFNQLMQEKTINRHTFLVAVVTVEAATGYRRLKYIPGNIQFNTETGVTQATFFVEEAWKRDELEGGHSEIKDGADYEITLRGSSILSAEGKALDGNFIGGQLPTGNGVQGGDFVSWFSVGPRGQFSDPAQEAKSDKPGEKAD